VIRLAVKVEKQIKTPKRFTLKGRDKETTPNKDSFSKDNSSKAKPNSRLDKGKEPENTPKVPKKSNNIKCFKCLGHGNIASECPNRKVMMVQESLEEESSREKENSCDTLR